MATTTCKSSYYTTSTKQSNNKLNQPTVNCDRATLATNLKQVKSSIPNHIRKPYKQVPIKQHNTINYKPFLESNQISTKYHHHN